MSAERTYPTGVTSWVDLEVDDVAAAQTFYGGLFGWTFERNAVRPPLRLHIVLLDGRDVGGLGGPTSRDGVPPGGTPTSPSTTSTPPAAAAAGRRTVVAGQRRGRGGRSACAPTLPGARFRLWQARRRLGVQVVNEPGAWNFSDLHTADPAAATAFYARLFGWVLDRSAARMIRVPGYGDHLAATVDPGIHERQARRPHPASPTSSVARADRGRRAEPHWHVTFTVADRDESASRAESLGGTVLATSEDDWTRRRSSATRRARSFTTSQFTPPAGF